MGTRIYGTSDDLIEVDGDVRGEHCDDHAFLFLSDGTILEVSYPKGELAIWEVKPIQVGSLFLTVEPCFDEDNSPYSDIALFAEGLKWVYATSGIEKVE